MARDILRIEITHENPAANGYFYSYLDLPASEHQIRDALQKARLTGNDDGFCDIRITNSAQLYSLTGVWLDSPTIDELNFLSKRIQAMNGIELLAYQVIAQKLIDKGELVSMKDLINCTYDLDEVPVAADVSNDIQLGAFIIENKMHEDVNAVPEDSIYLLDRAKIGKLYRTTFGAVFNAGMCVFAGDYEMPEIYDGKQLPEGSPSQWFAFRLLVGCGHRDNSQWLSLPIDRKEADRIAAQYGERRIENCGYYGFDSSVPQLTLPETGSMREFEKLNSLALRMLEMSPEEQVKFKAVLYAEKPVGIDAALDVAGNLHQYELDTAVSDDGAFFKSYLAHHLDTHFDKAWLDTLYVNAEGGRLLHNLGAMVTGYGTISARGRSLYELVPYEQTQTENMDISPAQTEDEPEQSLGLQFGGV